MTPIHIRKARLEDAEAMVLVHYAAVHRVASGDYPPEILEAWSMTPDEARYRQMEQLIANGDAALFVAESENLVGFSAYISFYDPQIVSPAKDRLSTGYINNEQLQSELSINGMG